jgi:hypothetical protein
MPAFYVEKAAIGLLFMADPNNASMMLVFVFLYGSCVTEEPIVFEADVLRRLVMGVRDAS